MCDTAQLFKIICARATNSSNVILSFQSKWMHVDGALRPLGWPGSLWPELKESCAADQSPPIAAPLLLDFFEDNTDLNMSSPAVPSRGGTWNQSGSLSRLRNGRWIRNPRGGLMRSFQEKYIAGWEGNSYHRPRGFTFHSHYKRLW